MAFHKLIIINSSFYLNETESKNDNPIAVRELPELDKYFSEGYRILSVTPVTPQAGQQTNLGTMQVIVHLAK